ncbi:MAG: NAD(P)/FAD-dependent oxidoreductase [Bdellovibrionales bacterium]
MKKLVLCGAGHAHLEVIKNLDLNDFKGWKIILITLEKDYHYSGSLPRYILGEVSIEDLLVDLVKLCRSKNVELILGHYHSHSKKSVQLTSGQNIDYDLLSLNLGGTQNYLPGAREVLYVRPISNFMNQWDKIVKKWSAIGPENVAIIGGGPAGIEISAAVRCLQLKFKASDASVHLFTKSALVGSVYGGKAAVHLTQDLLKLGIKIHYNHKIHDFAGLKGQFPVIISALPVQSWGFVVDQHLMLEDSVFAVGDCVEIRGGNKNLKSGVLAVRQGRHLLKNIILHIHKKQMCNFQEPNKSLNLLINGPQSARLQWRGLSWSGVWVKTLKNFIDSKYIQSFRVN